MSLRSQLRRSGKILRNFEYNRDLARHSREDAEHELEHVTEKIAAIAIKYKEQGHGAQELKEAHFTAEELEEAGFTREEVG